MKKNEEKIRDTEELLFQEVSGNWGKITHMCSPFGIYRLENSKKEVKDE